MLQNSSCSCSHTSDIHSQAMRLRLGMRGVNVQLLLDRACLALHACFLKDRRLLPLQGRGRPACIVHRVPQMARRALAVQGRQAGSTMWSACTSRIQWTFKQRVQVHRRVAPLRAMGAFPAASRLPLALCSRVGLLKVTSQLCRYIFITAITQCYVYQLLLDIEAFVVVWSFSFSPAAFAFQLSSLWQAL